jgi:hypothetical protein
MTAEDEVLDWATGIYWSGDVPLAKIGQSAMPLTTRGRAMALATLKDWLNDPSQSGVLGELRVGLAQLGWDTPSAAGRRLISELLWNTVLARFGLAPTLVHRRRRRSYADAPQFGVHVVDAPHGSDTWERSGWHALVDVTDATQVERRLALEWVLNALLYFDVELGLADEPLYLRRYRKSKEWDPRPGNTDAADRPSDPTTPPACPKCGAPMVEKANARTGRPFWSCSRYPDCRGSRNWQTPWRSTV